MRGLLWINLNICRCRQNNNNDDLYSSLTIVESLLVLLMMVFFAFVLLCFVLFFSGLLWFTSKTFLRGGGWHHLTSWQAWHRCCNYGRYQKGRATVQGSISELLWVPIIVDKGRQCLVLFGPGFDKIVILGIISIPYNFRSCLFYYLALLALSEIASVRLCGLLFWYTRKETRPLQLIGRVWCKFSSGGGKGSETRQLLT